MLQPSYRTSGQTRRCERLLPPKRVIDETKEYQLQEDIVGRFVDECCDLGKGRKVQAGKLYTAYKDYCKREGIEKPATSNKFADAIQRVKDADSRRIGKSEKTGDDGRRYYDGIGLHASDEQDPREARTMTQRTGASRVTRTRCAPTPQMQNLRTIT
jgi:phage/plasmid-associated DNA primase